jgi:hypothetical protein
MSTTNSDAGFKPADINETIKIVEDVVKEALATPPGGLHRGTLVKFEHEGDSLIGRIYLITDEIVRVYEPQGRWEPITLTPNTKFEIVPEEETPDGQNKADLRQEG